MRTTICGSMAFYAEMQDIKAQLEANGHEVKIPELSVEASAEFGGGRAVYLGQYIEEHGGIDMFAPEHPIWKQKEAAINDHFEKLEWCDAILVTNYEKRGVSGYVGGNTLMEIGIAFYLKKPIYILYPISSDISYKIEIMGMHPTILDGDVSNI